MQHQNANQFTLNDFWQLPGPVITRFPQVNIQPQVWVFTLNLGIYFFLNWVENCRVERIENFGDGLRKENCNQLPQHWTAVYNSLDFAHLAVWMLMGMHNLEYWSLIYHQPQWFSLLLFWNKKNNNNIDHQRLQTSPPFYSFMWPPGWTSF